MICSMIQIRGKKKHENSIKELDQPETYKSAFID